MVWGSTYKTNINPLVVLQKRTVRILSFDKFDAHTTDPLFARLNILKLHDIIFLYTAWFMYQFSKSSLPKAFHNFFTRTNTGHNYHTRFSSKSSFSLLNIRTIMENSALNFIVQKSGTKLMNPWKLLSFLSFKRELKAKRLFCYSSFN